MTDAAQMGHALRLAARGLGQVWPNPAVGCVIVLPDGRVVGRGWTQPGGRPHAERVALDQAGAAARGATAFVTLEPCAHTGQTPPCAAGLIAAGVVRVVSATTDPDPRVAGRGHAMLRAAGIAVTEGCREAEARHLNRGFFLRVTQGRPLVTLKLALTLDGRIATAQGESQWITGPAARHHAHGLRRIHDAVMVGGGTARADRPALNVRGFGPVRQPHRIIVTRQPLPDLPPEGPDHGPLHRVWGPLDGILSDLATHGLTRIFCEGGGDLAAQLLAADLVDDLVIYHAGLTFGATGRPGIGALPDLPLADHRRFILRALHQLGPDSVQIWSRD
ncbi:bifunctional diaminohydroxyphosphoribosylaminopyrimidine deaminase/5-amino-6-(5-phosphoribosylamino)uracil reductase RibD [Paracoccus sp. p3-h83]|uniref:bifunctional diaminohydroxyphosphoribosylaminopyrimidine deaminase/5-amino-6-(5-phosphoribosylamino)uracil reductase RibD n=1 Tax=Paracoccus sp. p3-h83 TaxID=3342805 RepID=UPI0035BA483E